MSNPPAAAAAASSVISSRSLRRILLLAVVTLIAYTVYSHRGNDSVDSLEDSTRLSYSPNSPFSNKAHSAHPHSSLVPFQRAQFKLRDPTYEVLVLRSSITHQDVTWRNTVTKNGKSWLIQTVAWIRVINGVRPELDAVQAWCKSAADTPLNPGEEAMGVQAEVKVLWTEYRDRGIGQDTLVWAECDATPLLRAHFQMSDALPSSFTQEQASQLPSISLDFAFEHKLGSGAQLETSTSGPVNDFSLWYTATDIRTDIHKPLEKVEQTACLSPAFYEEMPLLKWLEWREHMRRIGTERVVWYGRQPNLGTFVDAYNKLAGTKDVFRYAPPLGDQGDSFFINPYHDQDAWYSECILSHRDSSDYLLILDVDEFPMPDFSKMSTVPIAQQWSDFLKRLPEDRGCYEMTRVPMSAESSHGPPSKDSLVQNELTCVNGADKRVKSFYRANTVMTANQHKKTRMYPIGQEIASRHKAKANRPFWEVSWNSSQPDVWPKLFHYRWFSKPSENGCTSPSPLVNIPEYTSYLENLRKEVFSLKSKIELELGLQSA